MDLSKSFSNEKKSLVILVIIIFISALITDLFIKDSFLIIPLVSSFIFSSLLTKKSIPYLKRFKLKQIIRKEGPSKHQKKSGTPTMGGILIIPIGIIIGNLANHNNQISPKLLGISGLTLLFLLIGSIDDWISLRKGSNTGLKPKEKLILQICSGLVFLFCAASQGWISTLIKFPSAIFIDIGLFIWPLALFVIIAESNATNLTDGLDGLASGCGSLVFTGLSIQLISQTNSEPMMASFCIAMAGAWIGFLQHNLNPAKIFMGDSGSLAMGAALGGIALTSNNLWALLIMGGIFLAESISVILQVMVFKITKNITGEGKRIFRMAPLHHHYELQGLEEGSIVNKFWFITFSLVAIQLFLSSLTK